MKKSNTGRPTDDQEAEELEICISCLKPNTPGAHFCEHCGTPLTSYAATGPYESMFAEGDTWRKAASQGRWARPVRVLIIVLLLLMVLSFVLGLILPR